MGRFELESRMSLIHWLREFALLFPQLYDGHSSYCLIEMLRELDNEGESAMKNKVREKDDYIKIFFLWDLNNTNWILEIYPESEGHSKPVV